ncbi:class I SAM-dependent methyltransferase [Aquipuribacter sp. MA13-6]|uniref:class I SAM-dependent methyltransferase n=1 Tax=unclassified Aquipuribacter TaxID=2635084 RepID=UPI003EEC5990
MTTPLDDLTRAPDVQAPNLVAVDATDRLLLDTAAETVADLAPGQVVVVDDQYGALTVGLAALHGATGVRVHTDRLTGELALATNAARTGVTDAYSVHGLDAGLLGGARLVLLQLPRSLSALDEVAAAVARWAAPDVTLLAGGRVKHMTRAMNEVLARHFDDVTAGLGRQKSRVLTARGPRPAADGTATYPETEHHADYDLTVAAHGAAFAGTKVDLGTRFLLEHLPRMKPDAVDVVDLGCGTGLVACVVKRARPATHVLATDESAAAVASTRATAAANGLEVAVVRDLGLSQQPDASADLVLLNPPFHSGATVHPGVARPLFAEAARVLRPGGELWTVYNSHLEHKATLAGIVGRTEQMGRNKTFTVTRSVTA